MIRPRVGLRATHTTHHERVELSASSCERSTFLHNSVNGCRVQSGGRIFVPLGYSENTRARVGAGVIGRPRRSRDLGGQPCLLTHGAPGQARRRGSAGRSLSSLSHGALLRPGLSRSQKVPAIGSRTSGTAAGSGSDRVRSVQAAGAAPVEAVPCLGWRACRRGCRDLAGGCLADRVIDLPPRRLDGVASGSLLPDPCSLRLFGAEHAAAYAARRRSAPGQRPGVGRSSCRWCASWRLC